MIKRLNLYLYATHLWLFLPLYNYCRTLLYVRHVVGRIYLLFYPLFYIAASSTNTAHILTVSMVISFISHLRYLITANIFVSLPCDSCTFRLDESDFSRNLAPYQLNFFAIISFIHIILMRIETITVITVLINYDCTVIYCCTLTFLY